MPYNCYNAYLSPVGDSIDSPGFGRRVQMTYLVCWTATLQWVLLVYRVTAPAMQ